MFKDRLKRIGSIALLVVVALSSIGWGRVVRCESAAPLTDRSDASLESAFTGAVDECVRRASAMGLSWVQLELALVLPDRVIVRMVATDDEPEDGDDDASPSGGGPGSASLSL